MRILINDFGGYSFVLQLSAELASRGHEVHHAYCASLTTTPPGISDSKEPDSPTLHGIRLSKPLEKYNFARRWQQENEYGRKIVEIVRSVRPTVVVSANAPLDAQRRLHAECHLLEIPFVFWLQDVIGIAARTILRKKLPVAGNLIGQHYVRMERKLWNRSDAVVAITADFEPLLRDAGVETDKIFVIENWGPLEDIEERPRRNRWSASQNLDDKFCFLYTGTLSMKHDPSLLFRLAQHFRDDPSVRVVAITKGLGADWLQEAIDRDDSGNLVVLDYQKKDELPDVLGSADVLMAVLEPEAGVFSVPSKVLTYLCAGRPILLSAPEENLASRLVKEYQAGIFVSASDDRAFLAAARELYEDGDLREQLGRNARQYAETAFDISSITDRFEKILFDSVQ